MGTVAKRQCLEIFNELILKPRRLHNTLQFTERSSIVASTHAFHGMSYGALAGTVNEKFRRAVGKPLSITIFYRL